MYYKIKTISPQGVETNYDKVNHLMAISAINALLLSYGFTKQITKNTFNNILTRNDLLPDRLKFLINTGKLCVSRYNIPAPLVIDIVEHLTNIGNSRENLEGLARAMYGSDVI
jgi:hypothetical protein